jgi:hypothetical protein
MPKELEDKLRKQASKLAKSGKLKSKKNESLEQAKNRYIYGTLARLKSEGKISS